jgi:predicted O-methyltransferase YrrM
MNLCWLPDNGGTGHMPPSEKVIDFWRVVKEKTDFKRMAEIGFNAGHSSSIVLSLFKDVSVQSYDIGQFDITFTNEILVKNKFQDRFSLTIKDSRDITSDDIKNCDLLFVDGGHDYEIVSKDIELFISSRSQYLVLDDLQHRGVKKAYEEYLKDNRNFEVIHETTYHAVLPSWLRDTDREPVEVPILLIRKKF